ncbi:MAG: hypothetical protein JEZ08_20755 [Clostridiales bacterium]|nr:hypothetical protein [Clostridiales bacterium]
MKLDQFKQCILLDYNFGFLGEIYIEKVKLNECNSDIINKYFSLKEPYYCNRNFHYYDTDVQKVLLYLHECTNDINEVNNSALGDDLKRCIIFGIVSHLMNDTAKILGLVFSYDCLRTEFCEHMKRFLQYCTDYFVKLIFQEEMISFEAFDSCVLKRLTLAISSMDNIEAREYSEMDHPLILVKSYFAYEEYLRGKKGLVAPLQGASYIPPVYISLSKYLNNDETLEFPKSFDYLRLSIYDNSHHIDTSVENQVIEMKRKYENSDELLLIDDNIGTGTTIRGLKEELEVCFENITTGVIECRWETKVHNSSYPAFHVNDVDIISPLEYRHYRRFDEEIEHMKTKTEIHKNYIANQFYKQNYIYDHIDFENYINNSEIIKTNKQRLLDITERYKQLEIQCKMHHTHIEQYYEGEQVL